MVGWTNPTVLQTIALGAGFTFTSTLFSCTLAIAVEGCANKMLYKCFPHLYDSVDYAYGLKLPPLQVNRDIKESTITEYW